MIPETWRNKRVALVGLGTVTLFIIVLCWQFIVVGNFKEKQVGLTKRWDSLDRPLFEQEIRVSGQKSYIEVPHHSSFVPLTNSSKDFLIVVWFRLGDLSVGRRSILLVKYDRSYRPYPGYAIAFKKSEDNSVRPEVYWQDKNGKGGWFAFPDIQESGKDWQLLLLSFRKGRYLGLHHGIYHSGIYHSGIYQHDIDRQADSSVNSDTSGIHSLGGYDLVDVGLPDSDAALFLGTPYSGEIRANIGFFGIAQLPRLSEQLTQIASSLFAVPMHEFGEVVAPLSVVKSNDWSLLIGGGELADYSPNNHKVIARRVRVSEAIQNPDNTFEGSDATKRPNKADYKSPEHFTGKGHN